jgi:type IV secretory pathway TrbL component
MAQCISCGSTPTMRWKRPATAGKKTSTGFALGEAQDGARLLREAQQAFAEMGAAGHSARLGEEIGG